MASRPLLLSGGGDAAQRAAPSAQTEFDKPRFAKLLKKATVLKIVQLHDFADPYGPRRAVE